MSIHVYTKALYQKTIKKAILTDAKFSLTCNLICLEGNDKITIGFSTPLTGSEALRLDGLIASLSQVDPSVLIAINMEKITKFTEKLVRDFGEKNIERGYTEIQIRSLTSQLSEVMSLLQGKALPTVLTVLSAMTPTAELTLADINEFSQKITTFLGTL